VSVVGFDDIFAADVCTPGLTTLGGAHVDVGRAAVELLLTAGSRAADDQPRVVLPTALVLRRSTGNAPMTRPRRNRGSQRSVS
jgi:DNA-binding LacI/PurR family transcriptional regulator